MEQRLARQAHNLEVVGSIPTTAILNALIAEGLLRVSSAFSFVDELLASPPGS